MEKKERFIGAIQQHQRLITKVAAFYTDSKDDRDDLVQEIIYNCWKSFDSFQQQSSLSTWMYRVAMNVAIFHLRKNKKNLRSIPIDEQLLNTPDAVGDDAYEEKLKTLQRHIQDLNLLDKGLLMLYLEDRSYEEIAEITGLSPSNVGTRLSRIREKLKRKITQ